MGNFVLQLIFFGVKKLWAEWKIQGVILFSLLLQTMLFFVAPIRKSARANWVIWFIWSSYLLADAVANYAVGLICNSQHHQSNTHGSKPKESSDLLAFWAPFLLLHLGGPDTITAFSLEDNQLWPRHLLSFGFQVATVLYVFYWSLPNENLWIPTALVFAAGIIKYFDRIRALRFASLGNFRESMLKPPDPGVKYDKIMEDYAIERKELPTGINRTIEPKKKDSDGSPDHLRDHLRDDLNLVHYAYNWFQVFKGLIVDLIFSFHELDESCRFFNALEAEEALRIIELELNFIYGTFYTKVEVVHSHLGRIIRFITFGLVLAALGLFYFHVKKDEFHGVHIGVTYTLLLGAIALDVISFLMFIFSDRTFASIKDSSLRLSWPVDALFRSFLRLKKPRWHSCKREINSGSQDIPPCKHKVLVTPTVFRRWSGSVSAHNLVRYCLKSRSTTIHEFPSLWEIMPENNCCLSRINRVTKNIKTKISQFLRPMFRNIPVPMKEFVDQIMYVSCEPFIKELWEFIFDEIKRKSTFASNSPEDATRISSARGDWVLENTLSWARSDLLEEYVSAVQYDESLLLWHVATDLCYYSEDKEVKCNNNSHREFSKILSDYMLYLLVFQPTMMSAVAGIGKKRFRDTCAEAERFFQKRRLGPNEDGKACKEILSVCTDVKPKNVKGDTSKSVLFDASMLAKELNGMEAEDKWKLMFKVWVELVSHAAIRCTATTHAQQVSKGGELITLIWLLLAHFGLGEHFEVTGGHAKAKYYGKARTFHHR